MTLMLTERARLLVVIVNYRTPDLTIDCLRSLEHEVETLGSTRVVVADNDSGDGSTQRIGAAIEDHDWSRWATLMPLERNGGFSYGNNAVIRPALESQDSPPPEFILLLNPDTVVCPGALGALVEFMESHPEVGIAGSRVEEPDGSPQHSRYRFHSVWSELDNGLRLGLVTRMLRNHVVAYPLVNKAHPTDWVVGASMIVRRQVFKDIGLLDPGYFLYFEEADFCLNARRAGWSCWYVPTSRIVHLVGRSTGVTNRKGPRMRRPRYWFESRRRYFVKNHGRAYALCADAAWAMGFALWRVRRIVQRKPDTDPPHMLWDFLRFSLRPGKKGAAAARKRRSKSKWPALLILLGITLLLAEMTARVITTRGHNGMPQIARFALLPYRPPESLIKESLDRNASSTYVVRDAELGWTIRPEGHEAGDDGQPLYSSNRQGMRAPPDREYGLDPPPGKVRIVTVGDSFTHGDEVRDSETWQQGLEALRDDVEVLNLGVPAFGTDQALLRWRKDGSRFRAPLVVLGIWPENMCRNLSLMRYYLVPTERFSTKPRMVVEDHELKVINSPVLERDEWIATLCKPEKHPLLAHDFWYREHETRPKLLQNVRVLRLAESLFTVLERNRTRRDIYSGAEPAGIEITVAIAEQFARDVRAAGSTPLVLLIPMRELLDVHAGPDPFPLVRALRERDLDVLDLGPAIAEEASARGVERLFTGQGHMTPEGNQVLAQHLESELRPWLDAAKREPTR